MLLLKNAELYDPEPQGMNDILVEGSKVLKVGKGLGCYESLCSNVVDLEGRTAVPGYIDIHEHITGGGGEDGPASRCLEASVSSILKSGVTTCIGLLGTDGITRSLENLLFKARALNGEGLTCHILSGSYGYPPATLTGSVERDLMLIDLVVGVKTSASDHRSSNITGEEMMRLGTEARRAGLLSGKGGIVTVHMGSGKGLLSPVLYALEHSDLPATTFLPTHMGRTEALTREGLKLLRLGGYLDFTAGSGRKENETMAERISLCKSWEDQLTLSSDAFGSLPLFNGRGECTGLAVAKPSSIQELLRLMVLDGGEMLEKALKLVTVNPARLYRFKGKGCLRPGFDADIVVYGPDMSISTVFSKGRLAVQEGQAVLKGRFENWFC